MAFVIVPAAAVGGRRRRAPRGTAFVYSSKAALLACRRNLQHNHIPQAQAGRIRLTDAFQRTRDSARGATGLCNREI